MKMKAEIEVIHLQAKERQGLLATTRSWKEARKKSSLEPLEEDMNYHHLDFGLLACRMVRISFCHFKPPSL